uniref:Uncharacterized protein n=1 Tax=Caenorhabditis japonica TaxID=281687 RepID=A0A8R1J254_CAEJA
MDEATIFRALSHCFCRHFHVNPLSVPATSKHEICPSLTNCTSRSLYPIGSVPLPPPIFHRARNPKEQKEEMENPAKIQRISKISSCKRKGPTV